VKKRDALVVGIELAILLGLLLPPLYRSGQKEDPWLREGLCWILFWPLWLLKCAGVGESDLGVLVWIPDLLGVVSWGLVFGYALFWIVSRLRRRGAKGAS
jgi:hypothetical protein